MPYDGRFGSWKAGCEWSAFVSNSLLTSTTIGVVARRQRRRDVPRAGVGLPVRRRRRGDGVEIVERPVGRRAHVTRRERSADVVAVVVREHRQIVARRIVDLRRRLELALRAVEVLRGTRHDVDGEVDLVRAHGAAEVRSPSTSGPRGSPSRSPRSSCMKAASKSLPRAYAHSGSDIQRLPYGNFGPERKFHTPGRLPDAARGRQARHHERVDERVIGRLDPHGDLRPEVEVRERLPAGRAPVRLVAVGLERVRRRSPQPPRGARRTHGAHQRGEGPARRQAK